jgi:hypothetical protein
VKPDAHFEEFARDCIRLAREQKSVYLRSRLLALAVEWMYAAMHHRRSCFASEKNEWSRADLADLQYFLNHGNTLSDTASVLCRDEAEVRQKAGELGLLEHSGKRLRLVR